MNNLPRALLLLIFVSASATAQEQEDPWFTVAETQEVRYDIRRGSYTRHDIAVKGDFAASVMTRRLEKSTSSVTFERAMVTQSMCQAGYGKLMILDLQGKAKYASDFVLKGGTNASELAGALCAVLTVTEKLRTEKAKP